MKSVIEILTASTAYLSERGIPNSRRQAEELIADALGISRMQLYLEHDRPLDEKELALCREWLVRKGKREPLQYIRGKMEFFGCFLHVNRNVLIPRQETELLVERVAEALEKEELEGKTLWDVCTGSGCIGIPLKKRFPELNVALSDISREALEVAGRNAKENEVEVELIQGDFLDAFSGRKTDYFVCNPPYISEEEYGELELEVREFEPKSALVAERSGLFFYERLSRELEGYFRPGGKAWFEIGYNQKEAVKTLFVGKSVRIEDDLSGNPRFFSLEIE